MRWWLFLALMPVPVTAQVAYPPVSVDTSNLATKGDITSLQAQIPAPAGTVPPMDTATGAAGTGGTYTPGNAVRASRVRTATCTLDATAKCSGNWDGSSFPTGATVQPLGDPGVINVPSGQKFLCNYTSVTITGYVIECQRAQQTLLSLSIVTTGLTLAPLAAAPTGTTVYATAISKIP